MFGCWEKKGMALRCLQAPGNGKWKSGGVFGTDESMEGALGAESGVTIGSQA